MGSIAPNYDFTDFIKRLNGGSLMAKVKIKWHRLPGYKLKATWEVQPRGLEYGLKESDMDPIHDWSKETKCGIRVSFDMWRFKTPEEMTMFLLKWS
jgi:hypothetical protein